MRSSQGSQAPLLVTEKHHTHHTSTSPNCRDTKDTKKKDFCGIFPADFFCFGIMTDYVNLSPTTLSQQQLITTTKIVPKFVKKTRFRQPYHYHKPNERRTPRVPPPSLLFIASFFAALQAMHFVAALDEVNEAAACVVIFTGEGAHSAHTDISSLQASPSYAEVVRAVHLLFGRRADSFLADHLGNHAAPFAPVITTIINVLNVDRWRAFGLADAPLLLGHSIGEVASAYAAGMLTIHESLHTAFVLGQAAAILRGAMAHARFTRLQLNAWVDQELRIAAVNGVVGTLSSDEHDGSAGIARGAGCSAMSSSSSSSSISKPEVEASSDGSDTVGPLSQRWYASSTDGQTGSGWANRDQSGERTTHSVVPAESSPAADLELLSVTLCGPTLCVDAWLAAHPEAKRLTPPHPWHHPSYLDLDSIHAGSAFSGLPSNQPAVSNGARVISSSRTHRFERLDTDYWRGAPHLSASCYPRLRIVCGRTTFWV